MLRTTTLRSLSTNVSRAVKDVLHTSKTLFIENEHVSASNGAQIDTISPHDETTLARLSDATPEDANRAVVAAKRRFETFRDVSAEERSTMMRNVASLIDGHLEEIAELESLDCGKPISESVADVETCRDLFRFYAEMIPVQDKMLPKEEDRMRSRIVHEPKGVVAMVTPWNYPLMQACVKVAPALAAGCTMVLKPSPWASLTCSVLGTIFKDAGVPSGVFNVLTGGHGENTAAETLVNHPDVDLLSFTGSTPTGKALLRASADHVRPTSLELGGKGSLIVFDDVQDMDVAIDWAMIGIFFCAGQVCSATSRVLVHENIAQEFISRLKSKAESIRIGHPLDRSTQMGPVVSKEQFEKINKSIRDALKDEDSGSLVCGGTPKQMDKGFYIPPTVFHDVKQKSTLWNEEIFGPVLAVRTFRTEEEAIREANMTEYGLANAVLSGDSDRASRVSRRLDSGIVWANCNQVIHPSTPFGGMKKSGFGREFGELGLHEYLTEKTIVEAEPGVSWWWYGENK